MDIDGSANDLAGELRLYQMNRAGAVKKTLRFLRNFSRALLEPILVLHTYFLFFSVLSVPPW